jgi:uncharacterized protein YecA (UPF0149 family)
MVARTIFKVEVQVQPTQPIVRRPLEYKAPDPDEVGNIEEEAKEIEEEQSTSNIHQPANNQQPTTDEGVTTVIRQKGKSVYERMSEYQSGPKSQVKSNKKVGRNDPCPCGATKPDGRPIKYKHCHGK